MTVIDAVRLALAVAGTGLLSYGAWLHYPPLGFAVGGALLVAIGVMGALRTKS